MFTAVLAVEAAAKSHPVMILLAPLMMEILFCPTIWVLVIALLFDVLKSWIPLVLFASVSVLFDEVVRIVLGLLNAVNYTHGETKKDVEGGVHG